MMMNKILSICLLAHGVTAFAPVVKNFVAVKTPNKYGTWNNDIHFDRN